MAQFNERESKGHLAPSLYVKEWTEEEKMFEKKCVTNVRMFAVSQLLMNEERPNRKKKKKIKEN